MKKVILSLALLAGLTSAAQAQQGAFKYGVKGGASVSSFYGAASGDTGYKPGFTAGAVLNYGLSDNLALEVNGLYSQKGAFVDNLPGSNNQQYRATLQYIDVPLLLKYTFGEDGKGFFVEAGPQGSFLVANREFLRPQGAGAGSPSEVTLSRSTTNTNSVAIGYVGGIGYQLTSGLGLGARFTSDFSNVYRDGYNPIPGVTSNNNFRNAAFQLQAHYLFGGK